MSRINDAAFCPFKPKISNLNYFLLIEFSCADNFSCIRDRFLFRLIVRNYLFCWKDGLIIVLAAFQFVFMIFSTQLADDLTRL